MIMDNRDRQIQAAQSRELTEGLDQTLDPDHEFHTPRGYAGNVRL